MEFIFELIISIIGEFVLGFLLSPFYLLIFLTGAFLIWLCNRRKLPFLHYADKKSEDKTLHNYQIGCAFYFFVFILWVVLFKL